MSGSSGLRLRLPAVLRGRGCRVEGVGSRAWSLGLRAQVPECAGAGPGCGVGVDEPG